jgi:hypothetical protein
VAATLEPWALAESASERKVSALASPLVIGHPIICATMTACLHDLEAISK